MNTDWTIQSRSHQCSATGKSFAEGEIFHTLLFDEKSGFRREDLCDEAYRERPATAATPFSQWKTKYAPPPPAAPEPLAKQTAEDLLRAYMAEESPQHANVRYILALMLERKRQLKEIQVKREGDRVTRIYEHGKSGEVFVIPDPCLRLDQIAAVQAEVANLLAAPVPVAPASVEAPAEPQPTAPLDPAPADATVEVATETPASA